MSWLTYVSIVFGVMSSPTLFAAKRSPNILLNAECLWHRARSLASAGWIPRASFSYPRVELIQTSSRYSLSFSRLSMAGLMFTGYPFVKKRQRGRAPRHSPPGVQRRILDVELPFASDLDVEANAHDRDPDIIIGAEDALGGGHRAERCDAARPRTAANAAAGRATADCRMNVRRLTVFILILLRQRAAWRAPRDVDGPRRSD